LVAFLPFGVGGSTIRLPSTPVPANRSTRPSWSIAYTAFRLGWAT
jgi:hypothetical protein